jgi:hypothetical protein
LRFDTVGFYLRAAISSEGSALKDQLWIRNRRRTGTGTGPPSSCHHPRGAPLELDQVGLAPSQQLHTAKRPAATCPAVSDQRPHVDQAQEHARHQAMYTLRRRFQAVSPRSLRVCLLPVREGEPSSVRHCGFACDSAQPPSFAPLVGTTRSSLFIASLFFSLALLLSRVCACVPQHSRTT